MHFFFREKPEDWCNITNQTENPKILEPLGIKKYYMNGCDNWLQNRHSLSVEDQGTTIVNNDDTLVQGCIENADDIEGMQISYFDIVMNNVFNIYMYTCIFYHIIGHGRQDLNYPILDNNNSFPYTVEDAGSQNTPSVGEGCIHEQDAKDNVQMPEGNDTLNTTPSQAVFFYENDTITDDSQLNISDSSVRDFDPDFHDNNVEGSQDSNASPQERNSSVKVPDSTVRRPLDNPEDQCTTLIVGGYSHEHSAKDNAKMHGGNGSVDTPLSQKKDVGSTTYYAQLQIAIKDRGNIKAHGFTSGSESPSRSRLAHKISKSTSSIDTQASFLNKGHMLTQVRNTQNTSRNAISIIENASTVLEHSKVIVSNPYDRYVILYTLLMLDEEVKQLMQVVSKKSPIIDNDKNPKTKEDRNHKIKEEDFRIQKLQKVLTETSFFSTAILKKGGLSFELHSTHFYSQILDADELADFILRVKGSILLSVVAFQSLQYSNMKLSVLGHIKQSVASQMSLDIFLSAKHDYNEQDVNGTVANICVLRARRKTVLHSRYWLITEEVFTNAIRQTISVEYLYYTVIYPTDSRMNLYIPGLLGGFFQTKDTLTDYHLTSTNSSSGERFDCNILNNSETNS